MVISSTLLFRGLRFCSGGKLRSVATSRTPRMRQNPPTSGAIKATCSAGSSRSAVWHAAFRARAGCPGNGEALRSAQPDRPAPQAARGLRAVRSSVAVAEPDPRPDARPVPDVRLIERRDELQPVSVSGSP